MSLQRYLSILFRKIIYNPITYRLYEKALWNQIKNGEKPEHIGVILDGNRRWAAERSIPTWEGHQFGAEKVEHLLDLCIKLNIKSITIYALSVKNFERPLKEVKELLNVLEGSFKKILSDVRIHKNKVQVKIIGRTFLLPKKLQKLINQTEEASKEYNNHYLTIALAYGGRAEIIDATKKIAEQVIKRKLNINDINEELIERHLYTAHLPKSDSDLIIRTSGEERLSGFLLWQGAYSELCFIDVYWPDFRKIDLWRAIRTFQQRKRRYGR